MMCGEKGIDLGSALGPCTVQLSLRPETPGFAEVCTSRYAEPDAEGVTPVLRKIGRAVLTGLVLPAGFSVKTVLSSPAKTGVEVPPTGPLIRRLSVIFRRLEFDVLWVEQ